MRFMPSTLQRRFLVGLLLIVITTSSFFSLMLKKHMDELLLSEAHSKASLMVAHTEAIQHYVRSVLRPIVSNLVDMDGFIIEAMSSSYVTRQILSNMNFDEDFTYRRVSLNARNPESEMAPTEIRYLEQFLAEPSTERIEESFILDGRERLLIARPVYFTDSCMRCHGDPERAPAVLLDIYGAERGFWRQPAELAGLDIISVPMESAHSAIGQSITLFAGCSLAGMFLLFLSIQGFFNRLVVHNLRRVGHILHQKLFAEEENQTLKSLHREVDIEHMISSIESVADNLSEARKQLNNYARGLEDMVTERTEELETAVQRRNADVRLFMRLLGDLNHGQDKPALLKTSLSLIGAHFSADRAIYVCGLSGLSYAEWPSGPTDATIDQDLMDELLHQLRKDIPEVRDNAWFIPVQSSGQTRGLLALYWPKHTESSVPGELPPWRIETNDNPYFQLALALARQLGIALDNLDSLEILLRQNTLLDSIVEGVTEPLILVDRNTIPIMTNSTARALAEDIARGMQEEALPPLPATPVMLADTATGAAPVQKISGTGSISAPQGSASSMTALLKAFGLFQNPLGLSMQKEVDFGLRSFSVGVHPLSSQGGKDKRSVVHIRETTEEKRLLTYMRQSEKLAALGQLSAGLAHEINNPLGVIQCYAELIGETELAEQTRADLEIILRHVNQARSVLRDMLNFSRKRESSPGPCHVSDLLTSLFDIFTPQCKTAGIRFSLDIPTPESSGELPALYVDRNLLEQVIVNLLLNAIDSVKSSSGTEEGSIILRTRLNPPASELEIEVIDNGHGIPRSVQTQIFDPFFTTKEPGKGTGLGLSIAFGIMNELGGRLEVQSPVFSDSPTHAGCAFRLTLPVSSLTGEEKD